MDSKQRCESCGMPVSSEFGNFGTESDGSASDQYCQFCYQKGHFTSPDQTVDGMVQASIDFMTANLGYSFDDASRMSNETIRGLKRWN